jgi:hypothetical protein
VSAAALLAGATVLGGLALGAQAADHADTPMLIALERHDARLTGLHAFERHGNLVLAVSTNPTIPPSATDYVFPSDLTIDISIDKNANVDADSTHPFGGTIDGDYNVIADIRYRVTFDAAGTPTVTAIPGPLPENVFIGLRDDPFLRTPRRGRNVAAIVVEVPLYEILGSGNDSSTLLIWATARLAGQGQQQELAGRAVRNQFGDNPNVPISTNCLNLFPPRKHRSKCGQEPDVIIYDTDEEARFPNGRELEDDVDQLAEDQPLFKNKGEKDKKNDVKFLEEFPYLAPPHAPKS